MQAQSIKRSVLIMSQCKAEGEGLTSLFPFPLVVLRTAPVPKYLKMHYVKEEIGDGKGVWGKKVPSM